MRINKIPLPLCPLCLCGAIACFLVGCATMNMPVRNFMFDRDINNRWTQVAGGSSSGMHFDGEEKLSGINSQSSIFYYVNYYMPFFGAGGVYTAFEPYKWPVPAKPFGESLRFPLSHHRTNYVMPMSFFVSFRPIHRKAYTFGINLYPLSWPFLIGSASFITTLHFPYTIDAGINLHFNPTLGQHLHWSNDYGFFTDFDIGLSQTIKLGKPEHKIFYSIAFESYRGIIYTDDPKGRELGTYSSHRPDFRIGANIGYIYGLPGRKLVQGNTDPKVPYTWQQHSEE